jgi:hypothetical protein
MSVFTSPVCRVRSRGLARDECDTDRRAEPTNAAAAEANLAYSLLPFIEHHRVETGRNAAQRGDIKFVKKKKKNHRAQYVTSARLLAAVLFFRRIGDCPHPARTLFYCPRYTSATLPLFLF